ncbi:hypothetical protein Bca4012_051700 [Brassica carinata]
MLDGSAAEPALPPVEPETLRWITTAENEPLMEEKREGKKLCIAQRHCLRT